MGQGEPSMSKSQWEQGPWGWSIQPQDPKERDREDPVRHRITIRWDVPVMRFMWQAFPETLAHHDVFLSLN